MKVDREKMPTPDTETVECVSLLFIKVYFRPFIQVNFTVRVPFPLRCLIANFTPMLPSENFRWVVFNFLAYGTGAVMVALMISERVVKKFNITESLLQSIAAASAGPYMLLLLIVYTSYRGFPYKLLGRHGRTAVDLITLCAAVMLHIFFPYDRSDFKKSALVLLIAITIILHGWGQIIHLTWDICISDVLLQILMEVGTYLSTGMTCFFLLLLFCGVICYRFFSYSAPSTPGSIKEDLGPLAC